jgi:hypothetical protein
MKIQCGWFLGLDKSSQTQTSRISKLSLPKKFELGDNSLKKFVRLLVNDDSGPSISKWF